MSIKIGHASIDENGNISGGKVGDQTKKEICIRSWYDKKWNVYLEFSNQIIADRAADIMEMICADDNFGYDQSERLTGYNSIKNNKGVIKGAKGEFDCSSLVSSCYIFAGLALSPALTTRSIRAAFTKVGFKAYTDKAHLESDKYAKRGGIYLKEGSHVVMALENGSEVRTYPEPTRTIYYDVDNRKVICTGEDVKWVQDKLGIDTDGRCGPQTDEAIRKYQEKHGLVVDGRVGPATRKTMK